MSDQHDHDHQPHHGSVHRRTTADYARDFVKNWNEYEGSLDEKLRLTIRNRTKAYLVPPIKGCCGHPGEPGC